MLPAPRLVLFVLGAAIVAHVLYRRRTILVNDPKTNGAAQRTEELRQQIEEARDQLRADLDRARQA